MNTFRRTDEILVEISRLQDELKAAQNRERVADRFVRHLSVGRLSLTDFETNWLNDHYEIKATYHTHNDGVFILIWRSP